MRAKPLFLHIILIFFLSISRTHFAEARQDLIPGSRYTSGRAAALGDAYLPLGDDVASGLFYNPADLGRIRKTQIEAVNLSFYTNMPYISSIDSNFYNAPSLSSFSSTLDKVPGTMPGVGAALLPTIGFPGFAFGILYQSDLAAKSNANGTYTYRSLYQFIPTIGTGFSLANGVIRFGYSLQWVNQAVGTVTTTAGSTLGYDQSLSQGSGFSHNLGLAITAPIQMLPAVNVVLRNALGTSYSSFSFVPLVGGSSAGVPATEAMTLDASFSIQPKLGKGIAMNIIGEDRDATNQSGQPLMAHLAIGTEIVFNSKVFLRGGYGGGYPSGGFGLRRRGAELSLTYYTTEVGSSYLSNGDRRIMLQYQIRNF